LSKMMGRSWSMARLISNDICAKGFFSATFQFSNFLRTSFVVGIIPLKFHSFQTISRNLQKYEKIIKNQLPFFINSICLEIRCFI
jgi:hypothetical protein